ncbi:MAG: GNAT family N-acetyltransferase [Clostridia bacterium]|nr:GNAT family N-acetyltransferase [Clostridia bacterium]
MSYIFRSSNENEVLALTKMSERAFNSDKEFGGSDGGPTGFDDYEFHLNHFREGRLYSLLDDDKLVAGAIFKIQDNNLYIYRIFVDSTEFHKGHGLALMKAIEEKFSTVNKYYLDTPEWNIRTNNFYKKCGYTATGKEHTPDFDLIIFEKVNENAIS